MRFLVPAFAFSLLIAALPLSDALAQNNDMRALMSRMDQIQRQMDTISRQVYRGQTPPAGAVSTMAGSDNAAMAAAMDERMAGIEGSIRQLNNRLDEQDYALSQLKQHFDMFKSDVELQLREIGSRANAAANAAAASPVTATAPSAGSVAGFSDGDMQDLPTDNAAAMYDAAFQALREQKYERAEAAFKEFLKRYENDALAGNAQYWLGETYYVRGNFDEAARVFAAGYQKYPKSSKAPDNLLKLGLSLSQKGKKQEACVTFQQLAIQYSNAAAVIKQRAADERKKLECVGGNA